MVFRKDRITTTTGGGVFQTVKKDLISSHCSEFNSNCEILWTETNMKGCRPLIVGVFYRPPDDDGDAIEKLGQSLAHLGDKINSHNVVLTGDFNIPNVTWDDHVVKPRSGYSTKAAEMLVALVEDYGLTQHVTEPTRRQGETENILDLVFTNNAELVKKTHVDAGISDHDLVIVDLNVAPIRKRPVRRKIYLRKKADTDGIKKALDDFSKKFHIDRTRKSVSEKWIDIKSAITHSMDKYVPHKFTTNRFSLQPALV